MLRALEGRGTIAGIKALSPRPDSVRSACDWGRPVVGVNGTGSRSRHLARRAPDGVARLWRQKYFLIPLLFGPLVTMALAATDVGP